MTDVFDNLKYNIKRVEIEKYDRFIIDDPSDRLLENVKAEYIDKVYKSAQNIALSVFKYKIKKIKNIKNIKKINYYMN